MKRHALFVGINDYADNAFKNLRYSVSDAAALSGAFAARGFDTTVLTNPKADEILGAVEQKVAGLGPGDVFLFFFAGHGFTAPDGSHLLICANDKLAYLRHNRAGIPVDLLEEVTNGRGFNRAFFLDACRTDVFTGVENRGAETRDLALVSLPDAKANAGTCCVLRSCDRFCPAMEFDDLGHGVFTQAVMDVLSDDSACAIPFGETFVSGIRSRMRGILSTHGVVADQTPCFQTNGEAFMLFDVSPVMRQSPPPFSSPTPALVVCPVCGRKNDPKDTFRCRECGRDNLCLRHQDEATFLCADCAAKAREAEAQADAAERERIAKAKAAEEARRKAAEDAKIAKVKAKAERKAAEKAAREAEERNRPVGTRMVVRVGSVEVPLRWCPPGMFIMGSPKSEEGHRDDETQHSVTLTQGFWLGETQVTQGLWKLVMGENPSENKAGDNYPVMSVSWNDCQKFLRKLNALVRGAGLRFALPTEAQWEYACRAGTTGPYGGTGRLDDMGWHERNSGYEGVYLSGDIHPVAGKRPNAWGLYDMHGNVCEWCADRYGDYPSDAVTDPSGPASGVARVLRGGNCWNQPPSCRSAFRHSQGPSDPCGGCGLRLLALQDT